MGPVAVGVDLGGTKIAVALVDEQGRILDSSRVATDAEGGPSAVQKQIEKAVAELINRSHSAVVGVGLGVAGQIEAETGKVRFAPNLRWRDVPFKSTLSAGLNLPVVIVNDVRAITWGEWLYGAGKGCDDLICIYVGTGIGGGMVVNGRMVDGCSNAAAEIGHITIDLHGPRCTCGNKGCMEAIAGGWGIARRAREAVAADPVRGRRLLEIAGGRIEAITAEIVSQAYGEGDGLASERIREASDALIAGMVSLVNALNPCRLILGGGVIDGLPELVKIIDNGIRDRALNAATSSLKVLAARLGDEAGVIGSAALAMRTFKDSSPAD
jgi:glucokinase